MKKILLFIMVISIVFITGCWDVVEINQRIFPYSIGIDLNPGEGDKYIITISYPNIYSMGKNATQEQRVYIISTISSSIFWGAHQLSTRLPYPFYFKHLRAIVLGDDLAKDEDAVRQIIDGVNRDFVINKKVRLVHAEGMAKDLLFSIPQAKKQEYIEGTLFSMLKDDNRTSRFTAQTLTDFIRDTDFCGVSVMPRASHHGDDIEIYGGCIFKNYKFIAHLTELENRAVALIRGKVKEDFVDAPIYDTSISYAITDANVKKKLIKNDSNLKIKIDIVVDGTLKEYIQRENFKHKDIELLEEMERSLEKVLKDQIDSTIHLLQKKYNADVIGISEYLYKFHPKVWNEVSKDWDIIFPEIEIETNVHAKIRRRGLVL